MHANGRSQYEALTENINFLDATTDIFCFIHVNTPLYRKDIIQRLTDAMLNDEQNYMQYDKQYTM